MTTDELKKEAEEYTNTHDTLVMGCEENLDCTKFMQRAYLAAAEPREKRIAELETRCNELFLQTMQLTNAKELLNEFMRISKASDEDFEHDYSGLIEQAEQFLSEVEK